MLNTSRKMHVITFLTKILGLYSHSSSETCCGSSKVRYLSSSSVFHQGKSDGCPHKYFSASANQKLCISSYRLELQLLTSEIPVYATEVRR